MTDPLPTEFDVRYTWTNCSSVHFVIDQGGCGSCWVNFNRQFFLYNLKVNFKTVQIRSTNAYIFFEHVKFLDAQYMQIYILKKCVKEKSCGHLLQRCVYEEVFKNVPYLSGDNSCLGDAGSDLHSFGRQDSTTNIGAKSSLLL